MWRGNLITPLVHNFHLEGCLLSNPLPPAFGQVSEERGDLWPSPTSRVKEKLIKFPKEQIKLTFVASSSKAIHPNTHHPTIKSCWWCCILNVWFNLDKGEILRAQGRFGESINELNTKLNKAKAKFLDIIGANIHPGNASFVLL